MQILVTHNNSAVAMPRHTWACAPNNVNMVWLFKFMHVHVAVKNGKNAESCRQMEDPPMTEN